MITKRTLITTLLLTLISATVALGVYARNDISVAAIKVDKANVDIGESFTSKVKTGAITAEALGKNVSTDHFSSIQQGGQP